MRRRRRRRSRRRRRKRKRRDLTLDIFNFSDHFLLNLKIVQKQVEQSSDYRCVLARTYTPLSYFYL